MHGTDDRAAGRRRSSGASGTGRKPARPESGGKTGGRSQSGLPRVELKWILLVLWVLLFLLAHLAGCGYTVLQHPDNTPGPASAQPPAGPRQLPPGHPPIDELVPFAEMRSWEGHSFLDALVGTNDPLRFENVRGDRSMGLPSQHSQITLRMTMGGPAVSEVWQLRVDEYGWVVVAHWTQASAGVELDENQTPDRAEFRMARESESALRAMLLATLPVSTDTPRQIPQVRLREVPIELWSFDESGLLELTYRIETMDGLTSEDWPGGGVTAPLDLVQVLIGTWDSTPPQDLQDLVSVTAAQQPALTDLAMFVEGLILVWEVEGPAERPFELPLRVGR
jgi:hypothetical protein